MAIFGLGAGPKTLKKYLGSLRPLELVRFVLLDDVGYRGETWFLARAFEIIRSSSVQKEALAHHGGRYLLDHPVEGVLAFSDPVPRTTASGRLVMPGHVGSIYQSKSGIYAGRGEAHKTNILMPDGSVIDKRQQSKLTSQETGAETVYLKLVQAGARPKRPIESWAAWLGDIKRRPPFRIQVHPGTHAFVWKLAGKRRSLRPGDYPPGHRRPATVAERHSLVEVIRKLEQMERRAKGVEKAWLESEIVELKERLAGLELVRPENWPGYPKKVDQPQVLKGRKNRRSGGVILFSGGLDSVMLALLLKRKGQSPQPVYMSHRGNVGNVTKKELKAASKLARSILGKELLIVKAPAKGKEPSWYGQYGDVVFSKRLPVEKANKDQRNRVFLRVLKDLDLAGGPVALGLLDSEATPKNRKRWADIRTPDLERFFAKLKTRGDLITLSSLGYDNKVEALEALGRRGKIPAQLWSSESCLMYFNKPCGDCASCKARAEAFLAAWGEDKTPYRPKSVAGKMKRKGRANRTGRRYYYYASTEAEPPDSDLLLVGRITGRLGFYLEASDDPGDLAGAMKLYDPQGRHIGSYGHPYMAEHGLVFAERYFPNRLSEYSRAMNELFRAVPCPLCGAKAGATCVRPSGHPAMYDKPHRARQDLMDEWLRKKSGHWQDMLGRLNHLRGRRAKGDFLWELGQMLEDEPEAPPKRRRKSSPAKRAKVAGKAVDTIPLKRAVQIAKLFAQNYLATSEETHKGYSYLPEVRQLSKAESVKFSGSEDLAYATPKTTMVLAGSARRGDENIGDLDFVVVADEFPETDSSFMTWVSGGDRMRTYRFRLPVVHPDFPEILAWDLAGAVGMPSPPRNWPTNTAYDVQVNLMRADPGELGGTLLYATGPGGWNAMMRVKAKRRGLKLNRYGLFEVESGEKVAGKTEKSIFKAMGKAFKAPWERGK